MFLTKENQNYICHLICVIGWFSFVSCLCETVSAQPIGENTIPVFSQPHQISSDSGYARLEWALPKIQHENATIEFELQQSEMSDFSTVKTIYKGPDTASFISGLPNGNYFFRVRSMNANNQTGEWSEPIELTVQHHSLQLAFSLFAIGLFVFAATVFVVINGSMKHTI